MKATQLIAWGTVQKELSPRQMQVYEKVHTFPGITLKECASLLGVEKGAISGRFTELERMGVIEVCGERKFDGSKQPHTMYKVVRQEGKQLTAF